TSVYKGRTTVVQPDFTAECLAARNAGVEALGITMDVNSIGRIAASCARQSYHPVYVGLSGHAIERIAQDPNVDGMVIGTGPAPYIWDDNPAVAEFADAMKRYSPGTLVSEAEMSGWIAAKLFERAAALVPEPPSSTAVLQGLWT